MGHDVDDDDMSHISKFDIVNVRQRLPGSW